MRIGVIGAGISGLSIARLLGKEHEVTVYEKAHRPGGLIKCEVVNGVLYHLVGGHVFNSRRKDVLDWFWSIFCQESDFYAAVRHAVVSMEDGTLVDYPIENHIYQMPSEMQAAVIDDLMEIQSAGYGHPDNFDDFLKCRFGKTLYQQYFAPYNRKIWGRPLKDVPLGWLAGKLPMPTVAEVMKANIGRREETSMVHSSFNYPLKGGSQFLADTLAEGVNIVYNAPICTLEKRGEKWLIAGCEYDRLIFCGNVRELPDMLHGVAGVEALADDIAALEYHGTTSVLCEVDENSYSWIYMPSEQHGSHRIICTGNFSPFNAPAGKHTATIEFSLPMEKEEIEKELAQIPFHPRYLAHHYEPCSYPIQTGDTRPTIQRAKDLLEPQGLYLLGRFAEWEYYNMDAAMGAALDLSARIV